MTGRTGEPRTWAKEVNSLLRRDTRSGLTALDLFCGAGGLSLGFWAVGFDVVGVDQNTDAVKTYSRNLGPADCVELNDEATFPRADVIIAGPPCQPWSRAGRRLGGRDERDGFGVVIRAVQKVQPVAAVIENVPDLARSRQRQHLDEFKTQLTTLGYAVAERVLNAADYGVPQSRRRIFITALHGDTPLECPTPWLRAVTVREAIPGTCRREAAGARLVSDRMNSYIERYEQASKCCTPRDLHLDRPARTLTVRNLTAATGDMMRLRLPDGRRRMLTVREAARLQSFPDWFRFLGSDRSRLEQIGNAVPPLVSLAVANSMLKQITDLEAVAKPSNQAYPVASSAAASATMRANRRRDTSPERILRSALHRRGWRFRVDLPVAVGDRRVRPDIVFTRRLVAVFVDGCFWHACPEHGQQPRANATYWAAKLRRNVERDQEDTESLERSGWSVVRVWEHERTGDAIAMIEAALNLYEASLPSGASRSRPETSARSTL